MSLATLLHLADSSFPSGAFAHSFGLEYAIHRRWVADAGDLRRWMETALEHNLFPLEGLAAFKAFRIASRLDDPAALDNLAALDREVASFRPNLESRQASAQLGRSLFRAAGALASGSIFSEFETRFAENPSAVQQPVAWGTVCAIFGLSGHECQQSLYFGTLRQWANVAMRLIPLGQNDANSVLAVLTKRLDEIPAYSDEALHQPLVSNALGIDICSLGHESLAARYFRS